MQEEVEIYFRKLEALITIAVMIEGIRYRF